MIESDQALIAAANRLSAIEDLRKAVKMGWLTHEDLDIIRVSENTKDIMIDLEHTWRELDRQAMEYEAIQNYGPRVLQGGAST